MVKEMKKFNFIGETENIANGITEIFSRLGFELASDGICVEVEKTEEKKLLVMYTGDRFKISYRSPVMFFRGLSYILEANGEALEVEESPGFESNGIMLDVNQGNAAPTTKSLKSILISMALMGLNRFYIYMEDAFELPDEPYFGYMRSRYSQEELREIDDFAYMFGIEVIPCIQTLGHLASVLRWSKYSDIKENESVLLVGEEKTYAFIEKMIDAATLPFRSRKIHVGLDEAWNLGLGEYLRRHGYTEPYEVMQMHVKRVLEICKKRDLEPMMYSDMYMRMANNTGDSYYDYYSVDKPIPQEIIDSAPKDIGLAYWDYCHTNTADYEAIIKRHQLLSPNIIFVGGIWSWTGFGIDYPKTFKTTIAALSACRKCSIHDVFATIWGGAGEHNVFATLLGMQLWAELDYTGSFDEEKTRKRFKMCTGADYDAFMAIGYLDNMFGEEAHDGLDYTNLSQYLMWQDPLQGFFDKNIDGEALSKQYDMLTAQMNIAKKTSGQFSFVFEFVEKVSAVLALKAAIGIRAKTAYDAGDKEYLTQLSKTVVPELINRAKSLREYHRTMWFEIYKPIGWDTMDIKYGALIARLDTMRNRLTNYVSGYVNSIAELEEQRLYYKGNPGRVREVSITKMMSAGRISK